VREASDQVARNKWMCIFHAKHGAQAQSSQSRANSKKPRHISLKNDRCSPVISIVYIYPEVGVCHSCNYVSCRLLFSRICTSPVTALIRLVDYFRVARHPPAYDQQYLRKRLSLLTVTSRERSEQHRQVCQGSG
jgi:hypothetical protein